MTTLTKNSLPIILASSSPYRKQLLAKLGIAFETVSPDIDEMPLANETATELVSRLALEKARTIADQRRCALIIGSDQVAVMGEQMITKPDNHEHAREQLYSFSGKAVTFLTSLCLYNSLDHNYQITVEPFVVKFLDLSKEQIEHYLLKEKPYNCAGSFKAEGLGITLFSKLCGDDPNSLIGLPLIQLTAMLRNQGIEPLSVQ